MAITYKDAGVDVRRGYKAVELMKKYIKTTYDQNVLGDVGSFGGLYSLASEDLTDPVLVSGTDGVGTKLKYAFLLNKHDTVGIDLVAMCANDIVCQGAKPLFFLDYLACGYLKPETAAMIVKGIAEGCRQAGCALIGGETAEMPGFYKKGEYDLAGFCVGIVNKDNIINGAEIEQGDVLIGLASSGIHSNGYSLVRKLMGENPKELQKTYPELKAALGEVLLEPTRIYVKTVLALIKQYKIKGIAHITGGGFIENIPRILPKGIGARIDINSFEILPIFRLLWEKSSMTKEQIFNTFNMGIGMVLCVSKDIANNVLQSAKDLGEKAYIIGSAVKGEGVQL
ncbi:MAG: phosphoribosylformylglycinamidine cyclo-ligase [Clostridiales bacterium]|jgi:phosphoribosylformylglycinamidine cyclo-ligase|nr:phosphoribosylformylglycinamidine cyclo-ligase [Clostridiales bacterium]